MSEFVDDRTRTHAKDTEQARLVPDVDADQQTLDGDDASQRSLFGQEAGGE